MATKTPITPRAAKRDRDSRKLSGFRARSTVNRVIGWCDRHPTACWVGLTAVCAAMAAAYLPRWPRVEPTSGGDPLGIQVVMALTFERSPFAWFLEPSIDERSYRPLCMLLHQLEFRVFGTHDVYYQWISVGIHLVNAALLGGLTAMLTPGRVIIRVLAGLGACYLFTSERFSDLGAITSIASFWPAQSDGGSLLFALTGLMLLIHSLRTGDRLARTSALLALCFATWFKETAYVGLFLAIGISISTSEAPKRRRISTALQLALLGAAFWGLRLYVLGGTAAYAPPRDLWRALGPFIPIGIRSGMDVGWPYWSVLCGFAATAWLRPRKSAGQWPIGIGLVCCSIAAAYLSGDWGLLLLEESWARMWLAAVFWTGATAVAMTAFRSGTYRWLLICWFGSWYIVSAYKLTYGWYRYWPEALGSAAEALAVPAGLRILSWLAAARFSSAYLTRTESRRLRSPALGKAAALSAACVALVCVATSWAATSRWELAEKADTFEREGAVIHILQISMSDLRTPIPKLLILPGGDYPALWDRSDERTSVTRGLARLGFKVYAARADSGTGHRSAELAGAIRQWLNEKRLSGPVAVAGWSDGAYPALSLALDGRSEPALSALCVFADIGTLSESAEFARALPKLTTLTVPWYAAVSRQDTLYLSDSIQRLREGLSGDPAHYRLYIPYNDGPVFPREPNHWKRSLDLGIEHLVLHGRPRLTP